MVAVPGNYQGIVDYLVDRSTNPTAVQYLKDIEETLPRLWFNKVTSPATNDPVLNNMMMVEFPGVDIVKQLAIFFSD